MSYRHPRITPIRIVVLFGFATMLCTSCNREEVGNGENVVRPVRTAMVAVSPNTITRTYPAIVLPVQQAELAFNVDGRIIDLSIRASNEVKKGQAIAQLDNREFEATVNRLTSQLQQANLQLEVMKSGERTEVLAALEANVAAAEAQLETQRAQTDRLQRLFDQAAVARSEPEQELAGLASAEADLDVAQQI